MVEMVRNLNILINNQLFLSFDLKSIRNQVLHPSSMGTSDHRFKLFIYDVIDPFLSESLTDFQKTIDLDENNRTLIEKLKRKIENLKCLIDNDARPAKIPRIT